MSDDRGWMCLLLPLGTEWAAQFCADAKKVDQLRRYAARVVAALPDSCPATKRSAIPTGHTCSTAQSLMSSVSRPGSTPPSTRPSPCPPRRTAASSPPAPGTTTIRSRSSTSTTFRHDDFQRFVTRVAVEFAADHHAALSIKRSRWSSSNDIVCGSSTMRGLLPLLSPSR